MEKYFKEQRISFIMLNKEKYENLYCKTDFNNKGVVASLAKEMISALEEEDENYRKFQNGYFNPMDYDSTSGIYKQEAKAKLTKLLNENSFNTDSISFFKKYFLFYSSSEYFRKSWYCFPYVEFSEDFYESVLPKHYQYLANHRNDSIQEQHGLIEFLFEKRQSESDNLFEHLVSVPKFYILNEGFLEQIYDEMKLTNSITLRNLIRAEYEFLLEAIVKGKGMSIYIIVTSFET